VYLASNKNTPPTVGTISVEPADMTGIPTVTGFTFDAHAADKNNDPLEYLWEFGDGVTSSDPTPTHVYQTAGTFTVKVTVTDGKVTATTSSSVTTASLTGTWSGTLSTGGGVVLTVQQSGGQLRGEIRYTSTNLTRVVLGTVTGPRNVQLTFEDTTAGKITGTVSNDAKTITGKIEISGASIADITLHR